MSAARDMVESIVADVLDGAPPLMTIREAAARLGKTDRMLRTYIAKGLIRVVRPCGGNPKIARAELARLVREGFESG